MASACWKLADNMNMNNYIDDSLLLFLKSTIAKLVLESRIAKLFEGKKKKKHSNQKSLSWLKEYFTKPVINVMPEFHFSFESKASLF